ncbi:MAG: hypothetical protein H8D43_04285, partial [Chloroflexi bacterium]|nr:hypothetical protein [Chloroflexota bacterium]
MASPQPDLETEKRQGIVNPWADDQGHDRFHDDWDAFPTSDHEYLRRILAPVLDSSRYLCLWLPLRKDTESDSPIMTNYPGKFKTAPELLPPELPINMAQLLPLLRSIQNVRGWYPIGNGIQRCFNIWQSGRGLRDPDKIPADKPLALEGKVQIKPDQLGFLQYAGQEILLDEEPHFANLRCSDKWPSYSITDPETGEYRPERESVQPHAAICFTRKLATSKQACLSIHQAVFLPLDVPDDPFESVRCNGGDFDYSLTLHGCYFVDPGRSGVDGWDQGIQTSQPGSEAELRLEWNGRLAQEGMFPLLIQALEQFVDSCELSEEDQETLTSALAMSRFFQQYRKVICSKHQWVCIVTPEGKRWKLLSTDEIIYPLPMPPKSDPNRPFLIFNNLNEVHHLTFSELACLTAHKLSNQWPDDELCSILQGVAVNQVFTSRGYLDYLLKFLDSAVGKPPTESPDVSRVLLQLARQVLQIPFSNLSKVRSHIQRFIAFIPAEHRFPLSIDTNSDAAAALFSPLTKLPIDVLLVPSELDYSETPGDATLEMQDALRLLEELNMLSEEQEQRPDIQPLKSQLAIQIISAVTDRDLLLRRCRSLALFEGYDCSSGKNVLFSLKTLEELVGCNTLFRYGSAKPNDLVHARLLQRALDSAWVVVINKELADFLPSTVTSCDSDACMQILRMHPPLGKAEQRKGLLEVLVSSVDSFISEEQRRSLRYLLHAQPNADYENHFPLFAGGEDVDSVLIKLMKSALGLLGSGWRMVPNLLANVLTPVQRHLLRVRRITKVEVVGLLKQVDMTRLGLTFDEDEADTILREVDAPNILRALPIHQTLDGRRVAIGESIYRSGGLELHGPLGDQVILICSHSDPVLAAKQATIIPPLTPSAIIDLALRQDEPYRYWREVMDALERLDGLPTLGLSLRDTLRTTGWIPTSLERHVSLANVIHIGGLEIFIQRVVAPHSDQYMGIDALLPDVRNHPGFRRLVKLLPRKTVALAQLAKLMATDVCYHLGRVIDTTADLDEKQLGDILFAFQAQSDLLPAWEIIRAAREQAQVSFADCMEHLLPPLQRELSDEKTVEVLRFLANRHKSAPNKDKKRLLRVSHIYLKTAAAKPNFQKAILPCLEFLNKHEAWLRTSELAFNTHGIAPEHLLHPEQEQLLAAHKPTPLNQMADSATTSGDFVHGRQEAIEASADALEAFFATWKGRVNDEVIGGFLSLLGDDPAIIKLAQGYLGNRTLAPTRDLIGWKALPRSAPTGGIIGGGGEDIHQIMNWQRFVVVIEDQGETIELNSLLGTLFTARRLPQSALSHLFIGDRPIKVIGIRDGNQINHIRLARIAPADCTPQQLSSLLRESARQLLRKVYSQSGLDLDAAWDELEQSEQLDIQLAQRLLLDSSFFYLKQLGVHTHRPLGPLGEVLRRWEDARRLRAEEEQTQKLGRKIKITAQQEPDKTRSELADLLENDLDTQTLILGAVRRKVCDYQYNPQSIPFELFQNADDAAEELAAMSGSELPADSTTFAIEWDKQQITFIHWGRLVNQHRLGSFE